MQENIKIIYKYFTTKDTKSHCLKKFFNAQL